MHIIFRVLQMSCRGAVSHQHAADSLTLHLLYYVHVWLAHLHASQKADSSVLLQLGTAFINWLLMVSMLSSSWLLSI